MLNRVLLEIESSQGTLTVNDLSHKLGIDRSVLDSMIQFWVRKGRLIDDNAAEISAEAGCSGSTCGDSYTGFASCTFVAKMPKTFSLPQYDKR